MILELDPFGLNWIMLLTASMSGLTFLKPSYPTYSQVFCDTQSRISRTPYPPIGRERCHRGPRFRPVTT